MKIKLSLGLLVTLLFSTSLFGFAISVPVPATAKQFYELVIYHIRDKSQEERVDQFLAAAYLPAAHRLGVKNIGVFKTLGIDTASHKKIYVLLSYRSLDEFHKISKQLSTDKLLQTRGKDYVEATYDNAPYLRKESILLEAFSGMPMLKTPQFSNAKSERIYELRSYEGPTEKIYQNKVRMFNEGNEVAIFDSIGSQAVFYGEVLAGSKMPNLMYMTTYSDMKSREEHWKAFGSHPDWKKLSAMPEYQHNVSKQDIDFLVPAEYSDL
jgi:hypothetical protein